MTIEYGPPRPQVGWVKDADERIMATVKADVEPYVYIDMQATCFGITEARELCELVMTLAGHEWPPQARELPYSNAATELAERIIARLEEYEDRMKVARTLVRIRQAIAIVREECGVAE